MTNPVQTATANDIIKGALRLIGEVDANQSPDESDTNDALEALNYMVKGWQSQGLHLWTKTEGILPLDVGTQNYQLGPSGWFAGNLNDFVNTELSVAVIAADRTISVDSTAGIDGADDILSSDIANSTQDWTVVGGTLALSGTSLQVANAGAVAGEAEYTLTGLTVGTLYRPIIDFTLAGSVSVTYSIVSDSVTLDSETLLASGTSKLEFTATQTTAIINILNGDTSGTDDTLTDSIQVLDESTGDQIGIRLDGNTRQWSKVVEVLSSTQVYISDAITGAGAIDNSVFSFPDIIDRPMRILQSRRDTIDDDNEVEMTQWSRQEYFAQPDKTTQGDSNNWFYEPELTNGRIYIWPTASDVDKVLKFTYTRPIEINEETAENPDFPSEWFRVLKYNLAVEIAPEYRIPQDRLSTIKVLADEYLNDALGYDREPDSLNIQPDFRF